MMRKYLLIAASAFVLGAGTMAYLNRPAMASAERRGPTPSRCWSCSATC